MTFHKLSRISLSAADTSQTIQSQEISQLNETINDDLKRLDLWMQGNKQSLDVPKIQSMITCTQPKHQNCLIGEWLINGNGWWNFQKSAIGGIPNIRYQRMADLRGISTQSTFNLFRVKAVSF